MVVAISALLGRVRYLLKWNSFSNSTNCRWEKVNLFFGEGTSLWLCSWSDSVDLSASAFETSWAVEPVGVTDAFTTHQETVLPPILFYFSPCIDSQGTSRSVKFDNHPPALHTASQSFNEEMFILCACRERAGNLYLASLKSCAEIVSSLFKEDTCPNDLFSRCNWIVHYYLYPPKQVYRRNDRSV